MTHKREIFAIAIPAIVSNLTTPVLGLVDVAITGHIGASIYIGAIAVGGTIFNMLYWLFNFLRMGSGGLTAQAYGAGDIERSRIILYRALFIGVAVGLAMIVFSRPLCSLVLGFMDADIATSELARRYFSICIWGAPAVMSSYALSGWFVGMQDSRSAMWMAIMTNIVNIAVSLLLVFVFNLKIEGVATGTMVSQWSGFLLGMAIVFYRYRVSMPSLSSIIDRGELMAFFRINADIFFRTCCLVAVTMWFTHAGAQSGADILAANAILMQLFMLFSYFMDGFAYAGEALAGKYVGAADRAGLRTLIQSLLKLGVVCAFATSFIYLIFGDAFIGMLTDNQTVVEIACRYSLWTVLIPLCGFLAFIWDGIFVGLVATRAMLISMAIAIAVFFTLYFSFVGSLANDALWLAFNIYLLIRGLVQAIIHSKYF